MANQHKPISVIDLIKRDHIDLLRCTRILYDPQQAPNTRQLALDNFVSIWIEHTLAEERVFYPVVAKVNPDPNKSTSFIQDHQYLKPAIEQLRTISPNDVRFMNLFQQIDTNLVRHNDEEEVFVLREIQTTLTEEGLYRLGELFYSAKQAGTETPGGETQANRWKPLLDEFLDHIANYKKPPPGPHGQMQAAHPGPSTQPVPAIAHHHHHAPGHPAPLTISVHHPVPAPHQASVMIQPHHHSVQQQYQQHQQAHYLQQLGPVDPIQLQHVSQQMLHPLQLPTHPMHHPQPLSLDQGQLQDQYPYYVPQHPAMTASPQTVPPGPVLHPQGYVGPIGDEEDEYTLIGSPGGYIPSGYPAH